MYFIIPPHASVVPAEKPRPMYDAGYMGTAEAPGRLYSSLRENAEPQMITATTTTISFVQIKGQSLRPQLHPESTPTSSSCLLLLLLCLPHKSTTTIPPTSKTRTSGFLSNLETFVLRALRSTHSPTTVTCECCVVLRREITSRLTCASY